MRHRRHTPGGATRRRGAALQGWALVLLLVPAWEVIRRAAGVSPQLMPSVVAILEALASGFSRGPLASQIAVSLGIIAAGMVVSLVLAFGGMVAMAAAAPVDHAVTSLGALLHPLPGIVLLPVIVLWAGIGPSAVLVVIVHSVFWPVLTNLRAGYAALPVPWRMVAENYGVRGHRFLFTVALPGMAPYLLAGLRIAWSRAWRALISAEMIFGAVAYRGGVGWFIHSRRVFMDTTGIFAGILVVMMVGFVVEGLLFPLIEGRTIRRWGMSR